MTKIEMKILRLHKDAIIPTYGHEYDSGFDLYGVEDVIIPPHGVKILPTGIALAIPEGFEVQIRLRSGAAINTPLVIPNAPATIDSGYRGELGIILRNLAYMPFTVPKGMRIAQGVLAPVMQASFVECQQLPPSGRGTGGYGSTGP